MSLFALVHALSGNTKLLSIILFSKKYGKLFRRSGFTSQKLPGSLKKSTIKASGSKLQLETLSTAWAIVEKAPTWRDSTG